MDLRIIKDMRLARGWSQAQLAAAAELTERTIRRIESDARYQPTVASLDRIESAFGLRSGELASLMVIRSDHRSAMEIGLAVVELEPFARAFVDELLEAAARAPIRTETTIQPLLRALRQAQRLAEGAPEHPRARR